MPEPPQEPVHRITSTMVVERFAQQETKIDRLTEALEKAQREVESLRRSRTRTRYAFGAVALGFMLAIAWTNRCADVLSNRAALAAQFFISQRIAAGEFVAKHYTLIDEKGRKVGFWGTSQDGDSVQFMLLDGEDTRASVIYSKSKEMSMVGVSGRTKLGGAEIASLGVLPGDDDGAYLLLGHGGESESRLRACKKGSILNLGDDAGNEILGGVGSSGSMDFALKRGETVLWHALGK